MKYCTNCGNKLEENSNVCLKCGKVFNSGTVKKKKVLPAWAIVLIVLGVILFIPIIMIILGYVFYSKTIKNYNFDDVFDGYEEEYDYVLDYGTVGDTLDTGNLSFTLNEYNISSEIDEIDSDIYGKEYLILYFDVKNNTNKNIKISNYDFTGYADYSYVPIKKIKYINYEYLEGKIEPGETISGYIAFLVDSDWNDFEVSYNNYNDSEITFWLENDYKLDA